MIRHLLRLVWNRKRANALIVAEIFVSFLVVFAVLTGIFAFGSIWGDPLGYDWRNVWDVSLEFEHTGRPEDVARLRSTVLRMLRETGSMEHVEVAAVSNTPPYAFSTWEGSLKVNGRDVTLTYDEVTDDFASLMKMKVLRGRWFSAEDDASADQTAVIDASAAEAMFGNADPVGQRVEAGEESFLRIVGVVEDYRKDGELSSPVHMVFRRIRLDGTEGGIGSHVLVRVRPGTPAAFEEELVQRLQQVAPDVSFRLRHMDAMRDRMLRTRLSPLAVGGIVGLFLISMVALGLTGVLWQNVTRRTREIGVRRAIGASAPAVYRQMLFEVILLTSIAVLAGLVVVAQLPILGAFSLVTPPVFTAGAAGAVVMVLLLTTFCGLYPSWLASRLQPADALRYE